MCSFGIAQNTEKNGEKNMNGEKKPDIEFNDFVDHFEAVFEYSHKIVRIMQRFRGRYNPGPPKRWSFPLELKVSLAEELRLNGFTVDDSHFTLGDCVKVKK
jgi:hypothetical protein